MRIIAGTYRSRPIRMPRGGHVRPTKDRVREALFNIIRTAVDSSRVLDLFAGSGSLGLEALSRGAGKCVFVERDAECVTAIRRNIESLGIESDKFEIIKADADRAIPALEKRGERFDIIFADPPYYKGMAKKCLLKLDRCAILGAAGLIICEHHAEDDLPEGLDNLTRFRETCYGDICLSFYSRDRTAGHGIRQA